MSLTPEAITEPQLPRAKVGGYSVEATDEFLKKVAWEWRKLQSDRRKLTEQNAELERRLGELDGDRRKLTEQNAELERQLVEIHRRIEALRGDEDVRDDREPRSAAALAAAYRVAEGIRRDARREGETLLKKARKRATALDREVERAQAATADRIREIEETQLEARRRLSSFLTELLDAVEAPDSDADVVRELRERAASSTEATPAEPDR